VTKRSTARPAWLDRLVGVLPFVSLLGFLGIVVAAVLGFEAPHSGLLAVSAALLAVAPVGVALHIAFAAEFDRAQRRAWLKALLGRNAPGMLAAYFDARRRRVLTRRFQRVSRSVQHP
jgi:hypothetical protein